MAGHGIAHLTPRLGKKRHRRFTTFDIETWGLNAPDFAFGVVTTKDPDWSDWVFTDASEMWDFMLAERWWGYAHYAHNIQFDAHAFMKNSYEEFSKEGNRLCMSDGRFITGSIEAAKGHRIYFCDSLNYCGRKLEDIGEMLKMPKGKTPQKFIDADKSQGINNKDVEYCIQDTHILYTFLDQFNSVIKQECHLEPALTIGSTAMADFRQNYLKNDYYPNPKSELLWHESYIGGRVQTFQIAHLKFADDTPLKEYDVNSMYPNAMLEEFPDPERCRYYNSIGLGSLKALINNDTLGVAKVRVFIPVRADRIYPLPLKTPSGLMYRPTGASGLWGTWSFVELKRAMELGCVILETGECAYGPSAGLVFKEFVDHWWKRRAEFKKVGNTVYDNICKLIMNALYGKFGQQDTECVFGWDSYRPEKAEADWVFDYISDDFGEWHPLDKKDHRHPAEHAVFGWCAPVTSNARVCLLDHMLNAGEVVYCDTDSIHTISIMPTSDDLGALKVECEYDEGIFQGRKFYSEHILFPKWQWYADKKNKGLAWKHRQKGVRVQDDYDPDAGKWTYDRVVKPKEALRRGLEAGRSMTVTKHHNKEHAIEMARLDEL